VHTPAKIDQPLLSSTKEQGAGTGTEPSANVRAALTPSGRRLDLDYKGWSCRNFHDITDRTDFFGG